MKFKIGGHRSEGHKNGAGYLPQNDAWHLSAEIGTSRLRWTWFRPEWELAS